MTPGGKKYSALPIAYKSNELFMNQGFIFGLDVTTPHLANHTHTLISTPTYLGVSVGGGGKQNFTSEVGSTIYFGYTCNNSFLDFLGGGCFSEKMHCGNSFLGGSSFSESEMQNNH